MRASRIVLVMVCSLLLACICAVALIFFLKKGDSTPIKGEEGIVSQTDEQSQPSDPVSAAEDLQRSLKTSVASTLAPLSQATEEQMQYLELLMEEANYTPTPAEEMLETYLTLLKIEVLSVTDSTAEIRIEGPDLSELVSRLTQAGEGLTAEQVEEQMHEALLEKTYETRSQTVTVPCQINDDGEAVIEETPEYWDAVYGGLVSLQQESLEKLYEVAE